MTAKKIPTASPPEPTEPTKRPPPPIFVPPALRYGAGSGSRGARDLNVMLNDLGILRGRITAHYTSNTRNGVSILQQKLIADGYFSGRPDGSFTAETRAALLAHPDITTIT